MSVRDIHAYAGYSAVAIGGSARVNDRVVVGFGLGTSSGSKVLVNGGVGTPGEYADARAYRK
ncbi:YadA C-terminal domain-containing protein [Variovorax sp. VaC1]|uniref:YadA C-terminal domain-containing protein n=1 Tax=Variovorax sp. VaC1 TaxID=3373132 RepID=UPI003747AE6A